MTIVLAGTPDQVDRYLSTRAGREAAKTIAQRIADDPDEYAAWWLGEDTVHPAVERYLRRIDAARVAQWDAGNA